MTNTRYDIPRKLKRKCQAGSELLQRFYNAHFVHDIAAMRDGFDYESLQSLSPDEFEIAKAITARNLAHPHIEAAYTAICALG